MPRIKSVVAICTRTTQMLLSMEDMTDEAKDQTQEMVDGIAEIIEELPDRIHGAIADTLDATSDLNRQLARNMREIEKLKFGESAQNALDTALEQSKQFTDPEEATAFFQMRSRQILEEAKLFEELDAARASGDLGKIASLEEQLRLIEAASKAAAWPSRTPCARCASRPTPPLAITGIGTASDTARVSGMS